MRITATATVMTIMTITSLAIAFLLALGIVMPAYRLKMLTRDGAVAAVIIGTVIHACAPWYGTICLLFFFGSSAYLSRNRKKSLPPSVAEDVVAKGDKRDAAQVLANGGVAALCAIMVIVSKRNPVWDAALLGAIAAAMADTWSTEIGRTYGTNPVDWFTRKPVLAGTSGGITMAGIYGSIGGAITLAILGWMSITNWQVASPVSFAVIFGGMLGATADTMLGSTIQELRRCAICSTTTEKVYHCGKRTRLYRGLKGFNNDAVNFVCSLTGAVTAGLIIKVVLG
jgi:uncharacterized protein (TIGR00297 family)